MPHVDAACGTPRPIANKPLAVAPIPTAAFTLLPTEDTSDGLFLFLGENYVDASFIR